MANAVVTPFVMNTAASIIRRDSGSDDVWDNAITTLRAPDPSPAVQKRASAFKQFFDNLNAQTTKPGVTGYQIQPGCTIADVQREADGAIAAYEERGNSLRTHFFRTATRDFSTNASAIEILLEFLPHGDYSSIVCGALAFVFNAAKRVKAIREKVLDCLSALTRTVQYTKKMRNLYYGNRELWQASEELYIALLDAVEDMIAWLDEKAWRRVIGALLKQDNYAKPLEDKIKEAVETKAKAFHDQLEYCQELRLQNVEVGVDRVIRDVGSVANTVDRMASDFEQSRRDEAQTREDVKREIMDFCRGLFLTAEWYSANRELLQLQAVRELVLRQPAQGTLATARAPIISIKRLRECMQVPNETPARDIALAVQYGQTISSSQQARAATLLQHARFQAWFRSAESAILVVQGKCQTDGRATMTPLTYFTGLFATMLDRSQTAIPLTYVGGSHSTPGDVLEGAEGMLRLLIFDLLDRLGDAIDVPDMDYDFIEATRSGDIRYLCELFRSILVAAVHASPSRVVIVCLLDGLALLETGARRSSFEYAAKFFQRLVGEVAALGGMLVLKILLLYPNISQYARDWFPESAILTLGEGVVGGGHGYNAARIAALSESARQGPQTPRAHTPVPLQ